MVLSRWVRVPFSRGEMFGMKKTQTQPKVAFLLFGVWWVWMKNPVDRSLRFFRTEKKLWTPMSETLRTSGRMWEREYEKVWERKVWENALECAKEWEKDNMRLISCVIGRRMLLYRRECLSSSFSYKEIERYRNGKKWVCGLGVGGGGGGGGTVGGS